MNVYYYYYYYYEVKLILMNYVKCKSGYSAKHVDWSP